MRPPIEITSTTNPNFRRWESLLDSRGIKSENQFLVFGEKIVREYIETQSSNLLEVLTSAQQVEAVRGFKTGSDCRTFQLSNELFQKLDVFGTRFPILVCKLPILPQADFQQAPRGMQILSTIGDPSNLGALIRSAVAFGIQDFVILKESSHPYHPKALRAASGLQRMARFSLGPSVQDVIVQSGRELVALDQGGQPLPLYNWPQNIRLLMGEEGPGIPRDYTGARLTIPISHHVDSLNVAIASSLALYSYRLKHPMRE